MSRVFSALTGSNVARTATAEDARDDAGFVVGAEEPPFVEIGGPAGPVFSAAPAKAKPEPTFPRIAAPAPPPLVIESATSILSVRFHDVAPRVSGAPTAPTADSSRCTSPTTR